MAWTRKAWKSQCVSVVSDLCGLCWSLCFVCFSDYCLCVYVSVFFNDCCWSVCFCLFQGFLLVSAFVCFSGLWWSLLCVFQRSLLVSLLLCVSVITVGLSVSVCFSVFPQFLFVCFCVFQWSLLVQMGGVYFSVFFYDHCWPGSFCMFQCVSVVTVALSAFVCQWSLLVCLQHVLSLYTLLTRALLNFEGTLYKLFQKLCLMYAYFVFSLCWDKT